MKSYLLAIGLIPFCAWAATDLPDNRNLAYEDSFAWYVSGRLAHELSDFQSRSGIPLEHGQMSERRGQYEILFHHYLVECNGPLPRLAGSLKYFDLSAKHMGIDAMAFVGRMEYAIWPIVREWSGKILPQLLATYSKGEYGFFPACIVPGFKAQNPIPGTGTQ